MTTEPLLTAEELDRLESAEEAHVAIREGLIALLMKQAHAEVGDYGNDADAILFLLGSSAALASAHDDQPTHGTNQGPNP